MGQNITIRPKISSGAPSVSALEFKQNKISGGIKISHSNSISMSLVSFWLKLKSLQDWEVTNFNEEVTNRSYAELATLKRFSDRDSKDIAIN